MRFQAPVVVYQARASNQPVLETPATDPNANPPLAGFDAAGNVRIDSAAKFQATRWVPSKAGILLSYYIKVKSTSSDGSGYAGGTGGVMLARLCGENASNQPDLTNVLASVTLVMAAANPATSQNGVQLDFDTGVSEGVPYWIVLSNTDALPATNYFSQNYGYVTNGMSGGNASNQTDGSSTALYYGLDPRELVAGSGDSGATWNIPGDAASGGVLTKHVPTYIAKYADGTFQAQPYYSATTPANGSYTVAYQGFSSGFTLDKILVWSNGAGPKGMASVDILINDVWQESVAVGGRGFLRASLGTPRAVLSTDVVKFTTTVNSSGGHGGLALQELYADSYFEGILTTGTGYKWYEVGNTNRIMPIMPLTAAYTEGPFPVVTYEEQFPGTSAGVLVAATVI